MSDATSYRCTNCGAEKLVVAGNHHPRCGGCHGDEFDWANPIEQATAAGRHSAALESIEIKAQAGLCYFTLSSAREFLKDIRDEVADALGKQRPQR